MRPVLAGRWSCHPFDYWYISACPELMELAHRLNERLGRRERPRPDLQAFFIDRLARQVVPARTAALPTDTFRLLLRFASSGPASTVRLDIGDIDAPVSGLLQSISSRAHSVLLATTGLAARPLAVPYPSRTSRPRRSISASWRSRPRSFGQPRPSIFTTRSERPDRRCDSDSWTGRRDHAMLVLAIRRPRSRTGDRAWDGDPCRGAKFTCRERPEGTSTPLRSGNGCMPRSGLDEAVAIYDPRPD